MCNDNTKEHRFLSLPDSFTDKTFDVIAKSSDYYHKCIETRTSICKNAIVIVIILSDAAEWQDVIKA